jgi:hypothetical protein
LLDQFDASMAPGTGSVHCCATDIDQLGDDLVVKIKAVQPAQAFALKDAPARGIAGSSPQFSADLIEVEVFLIGEGTRLILEVLQEGDEFQHVATP